MKLAIGRDGVAGFVAWQENPGRGRRPASQSDRALRYARENQPTSASLSRRYALQEPLEPGESIYDLMRAVFPNERLMLKEHFRCVEPIIRFSMQFYPEKMLPLRIPEAHERLDPPLDRYLCAAWRARKTQENQHGRGGRYRRGNCCPHRTARDARSDDRRDFAGRRGTSRTYPRAAFGNDWRRDHAASFDPVRRQRDVPGQRAGHCLSFDGRGFANKTALTMLRYEQRFNVAVSRARDRVVLVRSVRREELNPNDLKARLIAHFENPMPELEETSDALAVCESELRARLDGEASGARIPCSGASRFDRISDRYGRRGRGP